MATGYYIYSVIATNEDRTFDAVPIGDTPPLTREEGRGKREEKAREDGRWKMDEKAVASIFPPPSSLVSRPSSLVYTVSHNGLAAVVSNSEVKEYPLTRENMLTHQKVNETIMKEFVVLPVKFCTIAEDTNLIVKRLLEDRREELLERLGYLADKNEHGLKVLWKEMPLVFSAIVDENPEIKRFKQQLEKAGHANKRAGMIEIGHMVKDALEAKKDAVGGVMFHRLTKLAIDSKKNPVYGDKMILNAVFLVSNNQEANLDKEVNKLAEENTGTMNWKYVGPTPAANFVEIVVTWED